MNCNKIDLEEILRFSDEKEGIEMSFKDSKLEEKYKISNIHKEFHKSIIFFVFSTVGYLFQLIASLFNNDFTFTYTVIGYSSATFIEFILAMTTKIYKENFKCVKILKYCRFFLLYMVGATLLIFPDVNKIDFYIRYIYGSILVINLIYLFYLEYNIIILVLVPVSNSLIFYSIQQKNNFPRNYFLPEIIVNLIFYLGTFLIKRSEFLTGKELFFEYFKNEYYTNYIQELINVINTMVFSLKKNELIFFNKYASHYLNANENILGEPLNNENEIKVSLNLTSETNLIKSKDIINSFFCSLKYSSNPDNNVYMIGKPLQEIISETFLDVNFKIDNLIKLGYFNINENWFEISIRKLKFNEEILEIFIQNITEIKMFEKKSIETKYKNKILSKIAHELKTPLISIISLVGEIMNQEREIQNIEFIKNNLFHINILSHFTIISISEIIFYVSNSIDIRLIKIEINLRDLIQFCFNILKTLIQINENKLNKIDIILDYEDNVDSFIVISDETMLKQIIINLISNAVKFTSKGFIKIRVKNIILTNTIEISVIDSGIGIQEQDNDIIFKNNIQLDINQDYNKKGSVIGLSIAKKFAVCLKHEIGFVSEFGKGSEFFVRIKSKNLMKDHESKSMNIMKNSYRESFHNQLKCNTTRKYIKNFLNINESQFINNNQKIHDDSTEPKNFNLIKTVEMYSLIFNDSSEISYLEENNLLKIETYCFSIVNQKSRQNNNKIVIIDDIKLVRDNTKTLIKNTLSFLKIEDFDIIEGSDGIDLLNMVRFDKENKIKLILIDENMEFLNGSEAVSIVRKLEECKKINSYDIASVTAFDDEETRKKIYSSGVNSILIKPCTKSNIIKILQNLTKLI